MNRFSYVTPRSAESAIAFAGEQGRFIAGGLDLLGEMKETLTEPKMLVNVKQLPGTQGIEPGPTAWTIGANVTLTALAEHPGLVQALPALAQAAAEVGSPQIRNVATLGGNLAQHSRCWYYRHRDVPCRKKGGSTCYARLGENKFHSLFTGCMCISPVVSNLAVALAALNAQAVVQRGKKTEKLTMAQLYATAFRTPTAHNSLRAADLILRVEIPVAKDARSSYLQASEKGDFDWALVSCSAAAVVTGRTLTGARIALGAIAPIPWQVDPANAFLEGKSPTEDVAHHVADLILKNATPFSHNAYKLAIARTLIRRTLDRLVT
jgi:xanthine dehydrogenase YagS FAD-binding subunit